MTNNTINIKPCDIDLHFVHLETKFILSNLSTISFSFLISLNGKRHLTK